jgi:transglutaminase-like putative cysteine protease
MAARRPSSLVTVSRAGLTLAAGLGLARVFAAGGWFVAIAAAALVPPAVFALGERRRWHPLAILAGIGVLGVLLAVLIDDPSETVAGFPTTSALSQLGHDLAHAPHVLRSATVPVNPIGAALVLAAVATYVVAITTELIARRLDAPIGAIGPSIAFYVAIAALGAGRWAPTTACYALVVIAYLISLQYVETTARRTWFQAGHHRRSQAVNGGFAVGALVVALAIAIGPAFPGARGRAWINYRSLGSGQGSSILKADSPLVSIGAKLNPKNPNREVFTVESAQPFRWRVIALDTFEKGKDDWRVDSTPKSLSHLPGKKKQSGAQVVTQRFHLSGIDAYWVPAAYRPVRVEIKNASVLPESSTIYIDKGVLADLSYTVESQIVKPTHEQLEAVTDDDLAAQRKNTTLPDNFPNSVGKEAVRVTAGATTPYDKALALQNYFQDPENFTYDLQPQLGTSTQALVNFLFKVHAGFCEQFAAAFGEMARSLGLPTRVAVGYDTGDLRSDGKYHVTERQAHAWPEVWLGSTIGWYAFEPTPGRQDPVTGNGRGGGGQGPTATSTPTTTATGTSVPTTKPGSPDTTPKNRVKVDSPSGSDSKTGKGMSGWSRALVALAVAAVAVLVAFIVMIVAAWRRTRRRRHHPDARRRVLGAWTEALERLAAAGVQPRPSATALEFALRQAPAQGAGAAGSPLMDLARLQTAAMYAPEEPSEDEAETAWQRVDAIDAALRGNVSFVDRWKHRLRPPRPARPNLA